MMIDDDYYSAVTPVCLDWLLGAKQHHRSLWLLKKLLAGCPAGY